MSLAQGIYNLTPPVLPTGGTAPLQLDAAGRLLTSASGGTGASANQSQGTAADNAAATGNPVRVGGKYNLTPPTYDDGDIADNQSDVNGNQKIREVYAPLYEDNVAQVAKVEQRYTPFAISTATTTVVKSGAGFVHQVRVLGGTLGAITVYDNTAASGTVLVPTVTPTAAGLLIEDVTFATGLTIVTAAATIITGGYR